MIQPRLLDAPIAGLYPCSLNDANRLLERFAHKLGPVHRPFTSLCHVLEVAGEPIAVSVAASTVSDHVRDQHGVRFGREQLVELARCAAGLPWANRVMLRLWRETVAPAWPHWPVLAAVSYSHDGLHKGDLYRFDGWERWQTGSRSGGGGWWTRPQPAGSLFAGSKTLWGFRYPGVSA